MAKMKTILKATSVYYYVSDMDRAINFYTKTLGLPLRIRFENYWAEVEAGPIPIGLHPTEGGKKPKQGGGTVSFTVKNIDKFVADLKTKGARVGKIQTPQRGKFVMVNDPDGNSLHFVEFAKKW